MFDWNVYLPISGIEVNGFALMLLGFTVGVIGGFFGIGGAFMVTPALNVFGFPMAYAIGTDMAHIAGKSIVATAKHRKFGNVDLRLGILMIVGTALGIELGATVIMWLEKIGRIGPIVRITYMVLLFSLGSYMLYEYIKHSKGHEKKTTSDVGKARLAIKMQGIKIPPMINLKVSGFAISLWVIIGVGVFTGFITGFLGVGGGFIRMPALMYLIGSPTKIAVGTDLFEVMFSGAYGAFSYALKAKVELVAAVIMLLGAAIGAQIGTTATKYARGMIIRLYFAITMLLAGVSVIFKHLSEKNKDIYVPALNEWAMATSGFTDKTELRRWLYINKEAVREWIIQQPDIIQQAFFMEKAWSSYSGYLMLGSACALSAVIIAFFVRGFLRERAEVRIAEIAAAVVRRRMVIAATCAPTDLPVMMMGARIAKSMADEVVLLTCEEKGICEDYIQEGKRIFEQCGIAPVVEFARGKPYKEILKKASGANLLVIGSRPLNPLETEFYLGDNATKIVRRMTSSTLVVKERYKIRRILLCIDIPYSKNTVNMAKEIASATDADIEILHVVSIPTMFSMETPWLDIPSLLPDFYRKEMGVLNGIKDELLGSGIKVVTVKLREGIVEEQIIMESVEGDFDLIVIKEGFFRTPFGLFLGRLSTNVATHSPHASVLVVKR
ncbi:TSUP family transporter [Dissulfurispira sp.]|uniref:TSUP family transporter n=1 Tax=Dissulfurispira sp. TaxID=2817609 RepID=UPI002FDB209E